MAKQKTEMKQEVITITEKAAKKLKELAKEDKKEGYGLKVFVFPGGCSGFQYGMDFEEKASKEDKEFNMHGLKVFLPKDAMEIMKGSKIDYIDSKEMTGFKIDNPNAKETCGCGSGGCSDGGCGDSCNCSD